MELFNVPIISDNEPMAETAFYKFISENRDNCDTFLEAIKAFLVGFEVGKHRIEESQLKNYKATWAHNWWSHYNSMKSNT